MTEHASCDLLGAGNVEPLAPEEVILEASCAFDAISREAVMHNRSGLTKAQTDIVMRLALFGPSSMTELAHNLAVSKEHITRAVNSLCEKGLVAKRRSAESFRNVEAALTEDGHEIATAIRMASIERLREPLATLTAEERAELIELAARAVELLRKAKPS